MERNTPMDRAQLTPLADTLDLATGTISERLQRIEAKLVAAYVDPP